MNISCIIVDDEPHARRYLVELLEKDPEINILEVFSNGKRALDFLKAGRPDLILLDIQMPGLNGMDLARLL